MSGWAQIADGHWILADRIIDVRVFSPTRWGQDKWGVSCTVDASHADTYVQRLFETEDEAMAAVDRLMGALR